MITVTVADGSERIFIPDPELPGVLGLDPDSASFREAKRLLIEHDLLTKHRRNSAPSRGHLAPEEWESIHIPNLARRARVLLAEHGHTETPTLGRILRW